jgi:hypothetical protein
LAPAASSIAKRVYNLGLDEFFARYGHEPRQGLHQGDRGGLRVELEACGLGARLHRCPDSWRWLRAQTADNGIVDARKHGGRQL